MSPGPSVADLIGGSACEFVIVDRDAVRLVIINRPAARNALTRQMRLDFATIFAEADADPAIAAIILTGADPAFCAGVDLKERGDGPPPPPVEPHPGAVLRGTRKPVIAAVNGPCMTGALEMALSCAFIIASDRSSFADTHAKLGLFPSWGQSALLPRAVGVRRARQFMLTGAPIDARTALEWSLVNEVVPHDALIARGLEIARQIAAADPFCARLTLDTLNETDSLIVDAALEVEDRSLARWEAWAKARFSAS